MQDGLTPNNIARRLTSQTPPFWKRVRRVSLVIGAIGAGILGTVASGGLALPAAVTTVGTILSAIGATGVAVSSAATKDDENEDEVMDGSTVYRLKK